MADPLAQALEASGGGNVWTILGLAVSGAMGKYAWDFYKKKADLNFKASDNVRKDVKEEKLLDRKERNEFKDDLKERVAALEVKLEAAVQAKEEIPDFTGDNKVSGKGAHPLRTTPSPLMHLLRVWNFH